MLSDAVLSDEQMLNVLQKHYVNYQQQLKADGWVMGVARSVERAIISALAAQGEADVEVLARAITELAAHPPDEWRDFESDVAKLIRTAIDASRARVAELEADRDRLRVALDAIESQCAGHADEFSRNVAMIAARAKET